MWKSPVLLLITFSATLEGAVDRECSSIEFDGCATFFSGMHCNGTSALISGSVGYLGRAGVRFDPIASVVVHSECLLRLCDAYDERGTCIDYEAGPHGYMDLDHPQSPHQFKTESSSAKCYCGQAALEAAAQFTVVGARADGKICPKEMVGSYCAVTFDQNDCKGRRLPFSAVAKMDHLLNFEDAIHSLIVAERCELVLCTARGLAGTCTHHSHGSEPSINHRDMFSDYGPAYEIRASSAMCTCEYDPSRITDAERCSNASVGLLHENCAVAFDSEYCVGKVLEFGNNTSFGTLRDHGWDEKIRSVIVRHGCELSLFRQDGFGGASEHIHNGSLRSIAATPMGYRRWDRVSSAVCYCSDDLPQEHRNSRCRQHQAALIGTSYCALAFPERGCYGVSKGGLSVKQAYKFDANDHLLAKSLVVKQHCQVTLCHLDDCQTFPTGHYNELTGRQYSNHTAAHCHCTSPSTTTTEIPMGDPKCAEATTNLVSSIILLTIIVASIALGTAWYWYLTNPRTNAEKCSGDLGIHGFQNPVALELEGKLGDV